MRLKTSQFLALLFTALALAPALAHLFELPNKIDLARDDYLTVQQIYRGWALFGFAVFAALLSNFVLAIVVRKHRRALNLTLIALLCIVGTQVVFWMFTYPANAATEQWTMLPDNWTQLRSQWEYSHAASAGLNAIAFISVALSILAVNQAHNKGD